MTTQVANAMPPPAARPLSGVKRRREVTTLDEDEWTSRIEAIIQRDYFPDLPKLQNKLEWLQVSRRQDKTRLTELGLLLPQKNCEPLLLLLAWAANAAKSSAYLCLSRSLARLCSAGGQKWRCHANTASTVEHSTAASWHQDACWRDASSFRHTWCEPVEDARLGYHPSLWHSCNDPRTARNCWYVLCLLYRSSRQHNAGYSEDCMMSMQSYIHAIAITHLQPCKGHTVLSCQAKMHLALFKQHTLVSVLSKQCLTAVLPVKFAHDVEHQSLHLRVYSLFNNTWSRTCTAAHIDSLLSSTTCWTLTQT